MRIEDLITISDDDLASALAEWKRWRNRVRTAPVMRLRIERFEEACRFIDAIERELHLRSPEGRYERYQEVVTALRQLESDTTVSLAAYRSARRDLSHLKGRRKR
jgi:hypothetical protein